MSAHSVLRRALALAAVLLVAAGTFMGLRQFRRVAAAESLPVALAHQGEFAEIVRVRGEISARHAVQFAAPRNVQEFKIVWLAEPASRVKAGQVVIRFDPSSIMRKLSDNMAAVRQGQATLDQAIAQARITTEQDKRDLAAARYQVERARLEASKQAILGVLQGEARKIDLAAAEEKLRVQEAVMELRRKSDEANIASATRQRDKARAD